MKKKYFKIIIISLFLILLNFYFSSCQIEDTSMKRVKILSIPKTKNNDSSLKIQEKYKFSYIFYKKNFIYFFDQKNKTLYKFTKTGDTLLKIKNRDLLLFKEKSYLNPINKENIKTKIEREFPFPEVLGIFIDYNDNIYVKVNFNNSNDIFTKYISKNQKVHYIIKTPLFEDNNIEQKIEINQKNNNSYNTNNTSKTGYNSKSNSNNNINNKDINNKNNNNLSNNESASKVFNIFFMQFDKYGDLKQIICKSKNDPGFNYFTKINFFKDNSMVISENVYSGDEESTNEISSNNHDFINFYLIDKNFKLIKKTSFSLIDIPKTDTEKKDLYVLYIINYFITSSKDVLFNVYYYKNNIPEYYKIIKMEKLNLENIYTIYQKQLLVKKIIEGKEKKVLLFGEYMIDVSPDNYYFFIKYIDDNRANLIIKDKYFKTVISKIINVEDIYSESQLIVGDDGSLYAYSDVGNNFNILYWASDVMLRKLKEK